MVIKKLRLIAVESVSNIRSGETLAYKATNADEWQDPHGGFFSPGEQVQLDEVARGESQVVHLDSVKGEYRTVLCRVAVEF